MNAAAFLTTLRALQRKHGKRAAAGVNLTPAEVVARWNGAYSVGTLANWRSQGIGPAFVKIAGRVLYPLADVQAYEEGALPVLGGEA